jgi:hypothetical protein
MTSSAALYICVDCELAGGNADPTPLNEHGYCPRCNSSSVVSIDKLVELAAQRKREELVRETPTQETQLRWQAMKDQRKRDAAPLVSWLKTKFPLTLGLYAVHHSQLHKALDEWDGWSWHVDYPWDDGFDRFTITLVQGVKNRPRWVVTVDTSLYEVTSFQDGTEQQN